jgi:hypothetical protein
LSTPFSLLKHKDHHEIPDAGWRLAADIIKNLGDTFEGYIFDDISGKSPSCIGYFMMIFVFEE